MWYVIENEASHEEQTSFPGLRLRQFGWNLLTWRTWMAHLMLRWCSWLVTFRNNKSFWGGETSGDWIASLIHQEMCLIRVHEFWLNFKQACCCVALRKLTTVRYCSICPSTLPSLNWSLYWGRPMSSSQPLGQKNHSSYRRKSRSESSACACFTSVRTSDPDVIKPRRLLRLFAAHCFHSQLELLPVQWILYCQLLEMEWRRNKCIYLLDLALKTTQMKEDMLRWPNPLKLTPQVHLRQKGCIRWTTWQKQRRN